MSGAAAATRPTFDFTFPPSAAVFAASQQSYLSSHPDARFNYIATGALVFDTTNPLKPRILLMQRSASDSMPNKWETPGGGVDDEDESILHAVARELWEEAGLKSRLMLSRFTVKLDPEEHQRFVWASEDEVKAKKAKDVELDFTMKELEQTVLVAFNQLKEP